MKIKMRSILIATLCVSQTAGFAGLPVETAPFLENANTVMASSMPIASDLLDSYKHALQQHPLETKMLTGALLATLGDAIAQKTQSDDEPYNVNRAVSFAAFDASYRALQHNVFPIIVAQCQGQFLLNSIAAIPPLAKLASQNVDYLAAAEQTLASQLGVVPFLYYPVFFALTGAVQGLTVEGAIDRAKENFLPLMERNLLFWIPVQFIQFGFVQEDLQIPFLCICGLAWTFILSLMAGSTKEYSYCITGAEGECILPDELFPIEEISHDIIEMEHQLEENLEEFVHDLEENMEVVVHDINVALHLENDEPESNGESLEKEKEEEEALTK